MCMDCWEKRGAPKIYTDAVREAAALIQRVYDEVSCVGGPLHVQLDDWNIEERFFKGDLRADYAWKIWVTDPSDGLQPLDEKQQAVCIECYETLRGMTDDERASALAMHDGYWGGGS